MAKKVATPELLSRTRRAIAAIGRGVNQQRPEVELEGRRQLALARVENEIVLGRVYFTKQDLQDLASKLFDVDDEDYTTDATTTNAEATNQIPIPVPVPDAEGEYEDEEDDIA